MTKPGWKTSEFWVIVLTDVGLVVASATSVLPSKYAAIGATISSALYALSRGFAKVTPPAVAVTGTAVQQTVPVVAAPPAVGVGQ